MIDDPMHFVAASMPTWDTSVHPLAELALMSPSGAHTAYLALRVAAWVREPPFRPQALMEFVGLGRIELRQ